MKKIGLLLLFLSSLLFAQERERYSFTHFSMDDGLSGNSVYCLLQDSAGYMWFGTFSGLNRYDGRDTTVFRPQSGDPTSISGSVIFSLLEDSQGRTWIGTDGGGLSLYDKESLTFTSYRYESKDKLSLPSNQVFALEEDQKGRLWIGTAGGGLALYREEGRFFTLNSENSSLVSDRIRTLFCDGEGILWIGTEEGLCLYDTNSGTFLKSDFYASLPENIFIRDIQADSSGNIWIGSEEGLFFYDRSLDRMESFSLPDKVDVRAFLFDKERLWIGTERSGLYIYNFPEKSWTNLRADGEKGSLSYEKIRCLYKDHNGLVWVGTRGGGINMYNPSVELIENFTDLKDIRQMTERKDGTIMVGTDGSGIGLLDRERGIIEPFPMKQDDNNSDNDHIYSFLEDSQGNLWFGTDGSGLYFLEKGASPGGAQSYPLEQVKGENNRITIWALKEDSEGTIWVGTEGDGLYAIRKKGISHYIYDPNEPTSLNGNAVRCIYENSKNQLWVGTWDGGLNLFLNEEEGFKRFVRSATQTNCLSDNSVNVIYEDKKGRLWIGTSGGGADIYFPYQGIFRNLAVEDGLAGNNIFGILEDDAGNIWLSSDRGLSRISSHKGSILNFSQADGLTANEFSQNAFLRTEDGTFFWGGPKGISSFNPEEISWTSNPSDLVFTGLSIHNLSVGIGEEFEGSVILEKDLSLKKKIVLSHSENNISVRFSLLSYIDPSKHHYTAQLVGLEERPRFLGNNNEISFALIPPGDYTLRVTGTDHNGLHADRVRDLEIVVLAPFWKRLWFIVLSGLLIFSLIAMGFLIRFRFLRKNNEQLRAFTMHMEKAREEERKSAAREYHDELGQHLTAMKFDLFWLNAHPEAEEKVHREKIASLLEIVDESICSVRTLSLHLRPKILDSFTLEEAIEWKSRRFTKRTGIPVKLSINMDDLSPYDREGEIKTSIFRIYQEVLTNIIRYAEADQVDVWVTQNKDEFRFFVRDNGVGLPKGFKIRDNYFGLIGMRERSRHHKGTFLIDNYPSGGTCVRVILPLKEKENA
jgi:ligand-binding sensor domain-containing protein/signal transduction histidine kinase